jgi:serine/threonine-protein kinase
MDCFPRRDLQRFLVGEMCATEAAALAAHVEECATCELALDELAGPTPVFGRPASTSEPRLALSGLVRSLLPHAAAQGPAPSEHERRPATASVVAGEGSLFPALPGTAESGPDEDVRALLQKRLAAVFPLGLGVWGSILGMGLAGIDPMDREEVIGRAGLALLWCNLLVWAAGSVALWLRRQWPIRWLRGFEGAMLVAHAAALCGTRFAQYRSVLLGVAAGVDDSALLLVAATVHNGFGWLAAFIAWGLVFPHPWWRMMLIVLGLAACPALVDAGLVLSHPAWLAPLVYPITLSAQILVTGLVMSLLGSHRLRTLEEQVTTARREARAARKLGVYTLERRLGAGGMGEVYLAQHRLLKRPCAVKLIRAEWSGDLQALARFDREVQATASLNHPNTVEIFDYGRTEDGTFFYVMEYLDGLSLEEVVRRTGPLPGARVVHVLLQLSGALRQAHAKGVIHRDVKPSNVLVCRHGGLFDVVKLLDFGLALYDAPVSPKLTHPGYLVGTPDYVAPEQADGSGADARSDIYSLGATAYFLLTGKPPYAGKTVLDLLVAHRHQTLPELAGPAGQLQSELEAILRRCLAKAPEDRYPTAADLERHLRTCAATASWSEHEAQAWWENVPSAGAASPMEGTTANG